jgi:hypothetical protein
VLVEEGLKQGAADVEPRDNRILLREWLDYATRRVPQVQFQEIERALAGGRDLTFVEDDPALKTARRPAQRPRVFYRRETERQPLVVAQPRMAGRAEREADPR